MQRKKMRKFDAFAKKNGLNKPQHREMLEEALSGCTNKTTRAKLRSRILRVASVLVIFAFGMTACKYPYPRVSEYTAPETPSMKITNRENVTLLTVSKDNKTWTWTGEPEAVVLELVAQIRILDKQVSDLKAAPAPVCPAVK